MVAEETMMFGIDNSRYMLRYDPYRYKLQLDCIRSYCVTKLESNPKARIGILTMGSSDTNNWLRPTSDLDIILTNLQYKFVLGGDLDLFGGISFSASSFPFDEPSMRKRILFFTGGPINLNIQEALAFGKSLKRRGVAVDVLNFSLKEDVLNFSLKEQYEDSKRALHAFVAAANKNNNSNIIHFQAEPCTRFSYVISSTPEIFPLASREEGEVARIRDPKGMKQAEAAADAKCAKYYVKRVKAPGMECGKHNPPELQNKFKALSLHNEGKM